MNRAISGAAIISGSKVLIIQELSPPQKWGFPKGKKEFYDNDSWDTMIREVKEEVGLDINKYKIKSLKTLRNGRMIIRILSIKNIINDPLIKCPNEIKDAIWIDINELYYNFIENPELFNKSIKLFCKYFL